MSDGPLSGNQDKWENILLVYILVKYKTPTIENLKIH